MSLHLPPDTVCFLRPGEALLGEAAVRGLVRPLIAVAVFAGAMGITAIDTPEPASAAGPVLSGLSEEALAGGGNKRLVMSSNGGLAIFYRRVVSSVTKVSYQLSADKGMTWSDPADVDVAAPGTDVAAISVGTTFYVAFSTVDALTASLTVRKVETSSSFGPAEAGSPPVVFTSTDKTWRPVMSLANRGPAVVGGAHRFVLGFDVPSTNGSDYVTSFSADAGANWSLAPTSCEPGTKLGTVDATSTRTVCITSKLGILGWRTLTESPLPSWSATAAPMPLSGANPLAPGTVVDDAGTIHAVWQAANPPQLWASALPTGSSTWRPPKRLGFGAAPAVTTNGVGVYAFADDTLSPVETWTRVYAASDGEDWLDWAPLSGRHFDKVFDYNADWAFTNQSGDALLAIRNGAESIGNVVGTSSSDVRLDSAAKKLSMAFTAASASVQNVKFWASAQIGAVPPVYRVGLQSDSSGSPSGTWLPTGAGEANATTGVLRTEPTAKPLSLSFLAPATLVAGTRYHVVFEPVTNQSTTNWIAPQIVGADTTAYTAGSALLWAGSTWTTMTGMVPRVLVSSPSVGYDQQTAPAAELPATEYAVPGEQLTLAAAISPTSFRAFIGASGMPTSQPVIRVIDSAGTTVWQSAPITPILGWNDIAVTDLTLGVGEWRIILDDSNRDANNRWALRRSGDSTASWSGSLSRAINAPDRKGYNDRSIEAEATRVPANGNIAAFNSSPTDELIMLTRWEFDRLNVVTSGAPLDMPVLSYSSQTGDKAIAPTASTLSSASAAQASWPLPDDFASVEVAGRMGYALRLRAASPATIARLSRIVSIGVPNTARQLAENSALLPLIFRDLRDGVVRSESVPTASPEGIVPTSFRRAIDIMDPESPIVSVAAQIGLERITGSWRIAESQATMGVVGRTPSDDAIVEAAFGGTGYLSLQNAGRSLAQLRAEVDAIDALVAANPGSTSKYGSRIDVKANRVEVLVSTITTALRAVISQDHPTAVIRDGLVGFAKTNDSRTDLPYQAGLEMLWRCTTGYVFGTRDDQTYSSAGHCFGDSDEDVYIGNAKVGRSDWSSNGWYQDQTVGAPEDRNYVTDIAPVVPSAHQNKHPQIYIAPGAFRRVTGITTPETAMVSGGGNDFVCFSGIQNTKDRCKGGYPGEQRIFAYGSAPVYDDPGKGWRTPYSFQVPGSEAVPGDSGSPVYYVGADTDSPTDTELTAFALGWVVASGRMQEGAPINPSADDAMTLFQRIDQAGPKFAENGKNGAVWIEFGSALVCGTLRLPSCDPDHPGG